MLRSKYSMRMKDIYNTIQFGFQMLDERYPDITPYAYALASSFLLVLASLVVKCKSNFPVYELVYFRSIFMLIVNFQLTSITDEKIYIEDKRVFRLVLLRSILSGASSIFFFQSNQMINLGESTILFLTSPIWSNFISCLFFGERFCLVTFVYTVISFISIIFLLKPQFIFDRDYEQSSYDINHFLGQLFSIGAAITTASSGNINKQLKGHVSKQQLIFYLASGSLFVSCVLKIKYGYSTEQVYTAENFGILFIFAILQYLLSTFMNQALFMKGANKIIPFSYSQVIFAFIFDYLLFHKTIDLLQIFSGLIMMFCCFKIATKK